MMYLLLASLLGGAIGAWLEWPNGLMASIVAAPFGASLLTFIAAFAHWIYQLAFSARHAHPLPPSKHADHASLG